MSVSATAKAAYEVVTVLADREKRNMLFTLIFLPFIFIVVIASVIFYRSPVENDIYLVAAKELKEEKQAENKIDGDLIRSIYMLHTGKISEDKREIADFITEYFYVEEMQTIVIDEEETTVLIKAFLTFEEILQRVKLEPFLFDDDKVEMLQFFKPYPELAVDDNFVAPCAGAITSFYGEREHPITGEWGMHTGIDICGSWHQPIVSIADGEVVKTNTAKSGYGNYIIVKHEVNGQSFYSFYAHLSEVLVAVDQTVTKGQTIGKEGGAKSDNNPGTSTGHHLHFEIRLSMNGDTINPQNIILKE